MPPPRKVKVGQGVSGFTLAEVLITLGIIGVIVALTLPSLINKYQAQVLRAQFLQANSILQNGILLMRNDGIDLNDVINGRNSEIIQKYFENGNCAVPQNESEADYYNYFGNHKAAGAEAHDLIQPYCLKNGMLLWFGKLRTMDVSGKFWNDDNTYSLLAIDINGWKNKPDRYGKDVFFWYLDPTSDTLKAVGEYSNFPASVYYTTCPGDSETMSEAGIGCTAKALADPNYFKNISLSH